MEEILHLVGGVAFFLYGIHLCAEALKSGSSRAIQRVIDRMVHGKIRGTVFGIGLTMITQSSGATSVIVLSLVNTSMIALAESAPILMGGAIGTSFTVQLISFRIAEYALLPVFFGIMLVLFSQNERWRLGGSVLLGFGLIFFGMEMMARAVEPLIYNPSVPLVIRWLAEKPVLALLASTLFTDLLQSSGAMIGLLISFSIAGLGQNPSVLLAVLFPLVLGANLGSCVTAFLAGIGTRREAQRVAVLQLVLRVTAVVIIWPFAGVFVDFVMQVSGSETSRAIANAHTLFNILATAVLLPFSVPMTTLVRKIMPHKGDDAEYLADSFDHNLIATPALALEAVQRELVKMAGLVSKQVRSIPLCFFGGASSRTCQQIESGDERIDRLHISISQYINQILPQRTTKAVLELGEMQFVCAASLESIADIAVKNILPLAKKYNRQGEAFSEAGKNEILTLHGLIERAFFQLADFLARYGEADWDALVSECEAISLQVDTLRLEHLARLVAGERASSETSAVHLDLIENLRRMENGIKHIATMYAQGQEEGG
jgi:phosphate:Na+ symporter